ncbi:MAG: chromate efflux transporter [Rhodospirillaceae bacterium]|nr:chromate efflux transporter [Rhodospirillaceae bacterium]
MSEPNSNNSEQPTPPTFGEAAAYWVKLGFTSFGGPAGQIAMMQSECVDKRGWIGQGAFLRGLNYSMLLPGPEAQQLAAYIGWRLHGLKGCLFAGTAFIIPGMVLMIGLAWGAAAQGDSSLVKALFEGVKPVVVAIIIHALWRIGSKACNSALAIGLAIAAFAAIRFGHVPFPVVVLAAGVLGMVAARTGWGSFAGGAHGADVAPDPNVNFSPTAIIKRWVLVSLASVVIGAVPCGVVLMVYGAEPFADVIGLFTTAAFVTFGGAYAVLPYIADAGVNTYAWLTPPEMINGLALAETTPGPLILVTTYVGFFAGWKSAGIGFAVLAAVLTTFVTFLPSFLFIIAGAPYIEALQAKAWARNALGAITAAVVGVIFNLAVFFGEAALLSDAGIHWINAAAGVVAFVLLQSGRVGVPLMVALGAGFGVVMQTLL